VLARCRRGCPRWPRWTKSAPSRSPSSTTGSDSVALETSVHRDGNSWVLNGAKRWIGNVGIADVIVVWARDTHDGKVKAIVVAKNPMTPTPTVMLPN
jgi:alkylation response protein AidB-like acyl-CoA dehydrogenase